MINGIRLKVCGITSLVDADAADAVGADYLGFIFYPKSPRWVSDPQFKAMQERLPPRKKVAVSVEPTATDLAKQGELGFDFFQVHFNPQTPVPVIRSWAETVGVARLWLAPRLPDAIDVYPELVPLAETFLLDTFHPDKMGGTGETGDWVKFKRHREAHPAKKWILSGGLNPQNVAEAVTTTGARWLDVSSGVEQAPGIKSPAKLQAFVLALHHATKQDNPSYGG
jgi:phosphoribosylanthranilate isomerase